jgi:hypothetical protein
MRHLSLAFVLVAGCFTPDLGEGQVACGADGQCPPGYACRTDGHCYHDATGDGGAGGGHDLGSGDLAPHCDRDCPPASTCTAGICAPPVGAMMCQRVQDCALGLVCDEYNIGGMLRGFCTPPVVGAPGGSAASCSMPGDDASCRTGICAVDSKDSGKRACLYPCKGDGDCPGSKCQSTVGQPSSIDGAPAGALKFCSGN